MWRACTCSLMKKHVTSHMPTSLLLSSSYCPSFPIHPHPVLSSSPFCTILLPIQFYPSPHPVLSSLSSIILLPSQCYPPHPVLSSLSSIILLPIQYYPPHPVLSSSPSTSSTNIPSSLTLFNPFIHLLTSVLPPFHTSSYLCSSTIS